MASNQFAVAFIELLDANDGLCGTRQFVILDGKERRAIISEVSSEIIEAFGGKADAGGFTCQIPVEGLSDDPEKGDPVLRMGKKPEFEVLGGVKKINDAVYEIVCGDPAAEET